MTRPARTIDVRCPKCHAEPGRPCVTPRGLVRGAPHVARRNAHPAWDRPAQEWRPERPS